MHRPVLPTDAVDRLEPDAHARTRRFVSDRAQALDDGVAIVARSRQAHDAELGSNRREPVHRCADRVDPLRAAPSDLPSAAAAGSTAPRWNRAAALEPARLELLERLRRRRLPEA